MLNKEIDYLIITHIKLGTMKNISEMKITVDELTAYQEDISEIKNIVIKAIQNETRKKKLNRALEVWTISSNLNTHKERRERGDKKFWRDNDWWFFLIW